MKIQKKHLLGMLLVGILGINIPVFASAGQWSASGSTIYYNDGNVGLGSPNNTPKSKLDVNGNIQISNSTIPMGLMTEVTGGTTPILDLSLNFRESNKNNTYKGGGIRIDSRNTDPLFQWISRKAGSTQENVVMSLTENGQLNVPNGVIQRGTPAITATKDLGLYSQVPGDYMRFVTNGGQIRFFTDGGIGNSTAVAIINHDMVVDGALKAHELQIKSNPWADYVFDNNYQLKSLTEVESYINTNKHLPDIPSASEVQTNGISVGDMQAKQMAKIEELTLYVIDLQKQVDSLKALVNNN